MLNTVRSHKNKIEKNQDSINNLALPPKVVQKRKILNASPNLPLII